VWDDARDLVVITSDHGNMEDISIRQHTTNDVPTVAIGAARHTFAEGLHDLTGIAPGVLRAMGLDSAASE
jgi:bisphosphoglycerate-independent phosphoglycerate mutase (AlkP superfamily)